MFCVKCGNTMEEGELFCAKCGTPVNGEAAREPLKVKNIGSKKKALIAVAIAAIAAIIAMAALFIFGDNPVKDLKEAKAGDKPVKDLKEAKAGDIVTYGTYEQDGDYDNGKEAIEWIVLDKQDGKLLLISRYALAAMSYDYKGEEETWEKCSLRKWLNGIFVKEAFTDKEIKHIPTAKVTADKNPEYDIDPGNDTEDQVFLLSIPEFKKYFKTGDERYCHPTEYAMITGGDNGSVMITGSGGDSYCSWWLRSHGSDGDDIHDAVVVKEPGNQTDMIYTWCGWRGGVRPALWVDLES